jgi:hypothetical protein
MEGTALARDLLAQSKLAAQRFREDVGRRPCLAAVIVGDDPASVTYVKMKSARCEQVGIEPRLVALPAAASPAEAVQAVDGLSKDTTVDGILVQHPVPPHVDERAVDRKPGDTRSRRRRADDDRRPAPPDGGRGAGARVSGQLTMREGGCVRAPNRTAKPIRNRETPPCAVS